jgi:cathepsin X
MKEVYHRGPIACGIDANPLLDYTTGIIDNPGNDTDHIISVVGWGSYTNETDGAESMYWIVRNSWGEYWGEHGFVRVKFGSLQVEGQCSYAILKDFTAPERNNQVHCHEDGSNCAFRNSVPDSSVVV